MHPKTCNGAGKKKTVKLEKLKWCHYLIARYPQLLVVILPTPHRLWEFSLGMCISCPFTTLNFECGNDNKITERFYKEEL